MRLTKFNPLPYVQSNQLILPLSAYTSQMLGKIWETVLFLSYLRRNSVISRLIARVVSPAPVDAMAQWLEHSPSTRAAPVRFPQSRIYYTFFFSLSLYKQDYLLNYLDDSVLGILILFIHCCNLIGKCLCVFVAS